MYGKEIDDIIELFEDIEKSCSLCNEQGEVLWCNSYTQTAQLILYVGRNLSDIFIRNEDEYEKANKAILLQNSVKGEFSCFMMDFKFKAIGIKADGKTYSFWIFEKVEPRRKHNPNKLSEQHLSNIASNYSNLIYDIYNTTEPIARALERASFFDELAYINIITKSCNEMFRMMTNIDEYVRIISEKYLSFPTLCSLRTELNVFCTQLNALLQPSDFVVELSFEDDDKYFVEVDVYKLYFVLLNVLNNSFKHAFTSVPIKIHISEVDSFAVIEITDEGDGINKDIVSHVFEQFYSSAPVTNVPEGLGLGLFVVKSIIEQHGGNVSISSVEYLGTTLTLRLPLADVPQSSKYLGSGKVMFDMLEEPLSMVHSFLPTVCTALD